MGKEIENRISLFLKKADKKLRTSKKLYDDGEFEDAISRAYYAMYHAARALLLTKHIEPKTHKGVLTTLNQFFIHTGTLEKAYAKMLAYAKELRENGDYSEYYVAAEEDARTVIEDATKFLEEIKTLLKK